MTNPLTLEPEFWEHESSCLLLSRNLHYVTKENASKRCEEMKALLSLIPNKEKYSSSSSSCVKMSDEYERIFVEDAKRTFRSEFCQSMEVRALKSVFSYLLDYHQGLGFLISYLRLFLNEADTCLLACYLADTVCYGYFKLQNEQYLRDSYIFDHLLQNHLFKMKNGGSGGGGEEVQDKITDLESSVPLLPDDDVYDDEMKGSIELLARSTFSGQYLSKFIIGFCVHVFPFESINFLIKSILTSTAREREEMRKKEQRAEDEKEGEGKAKLFWLKFCFSLIKVLSKKMIQLKSTSQIIQLLKFDYQILKQLYSTEEVMEFQEKEKMVGQTTAVAEEATAGEATAEEAAEEEGVVRDEEYMVLNLSRRALLMTDSVHVDSNDFRKAQETVDAFLLQQKIQREKQQAEDDDDDEDFNFSDEEEED